MTLNDWLQSIKKPVLVVGNAVLITPVPDMEYESVIRLNSYSLGGLSGNKVTHWVANGYPDIERRPLDSVLIPWSLKLCESRRVPMQPFQEAMQGITIIHTPDDVHIRWWFPYAAVSGRTFPTTGFCLLALLKGKNFTPDIVGFDGMKTGHQNNPNFGHGHRRTVAKEVLYLNSWGLKRR